MDRKMVSLVQNIDTADIWYCEAGDKQLYVGLVKAGRTQFMMSVIAVSPEEAMDKMSADGDVVLARSMRDIISDFLVKEDPLEM